MSIPLRCRCGTVQGHLDSPRTGCRAVCYCRDCQTYARFLGEPERLLDDAGGTEVIATLPRHVHFTAGVDRIACMSLGPRGLYRWYAACCRTPLGNTPRNPKMSYVGVPTVCMAVSAEELDSTFGVRRLAVNTASASRTLPSSRAANLPGLFKILRNLAWARIGGGYRQNPFFRPGTAEPVQVAQVLVLSRKE